MNPPDPHNTNASPPTFAELLAQATRGPFGVSESGKSIRHGDPEEYLSVCHTSFETTEHTPADMELITRLLNFAHAGGVGALEDLIGHTLHYASMQHAKPGAHMDAANARRILSILNGQTLNNPSK